MLNPYFLNSSKQEQNLIQSLVNEQLKMYGVEIFYIPRKYLKKNTVIREVIQSEFDNAYPIEAYVDSYDGYGGQGTLLSKFGIENQDDLTLIVSKDRYENFITPLIKNLPNIELADRPKEGDLIYFPLGDRLFEINYVEHEQPFYQLQKNYVYTLKCQLFRYEDEVLDTGVDEIDDEIEDIGYIQSLTLIAVGSATTAVGTANTCISGSLTQATITDIGGGYTSAPVVAISSAPTGGTTAVGIASVTTAIACDGQKGGSIFAILFSNAGCGYTVAPIISISGGGGSGAKATVGITTSPNDGLTNFSIQSVSIGNSGGGYVTAPIVGISTPKHVGAAATAVLATPSQVGAGVSVIGAPISIGSSAYLFPYGTTGGVYYKSAPTVTFDPPTGTGNNALATSTLDTYHLTGGTVKTLGLTTEGRFYTSVPSVFIPHPGFSFASATIGLAGSSINPSSVAFSTTGRAYTTAPNVFIGLGTGSDVTQTAVGIATIAPITGFVTAVGFNSTTDLWCVGTGATIGAGYTVTPTISFSGTPSASQATASVTVSLAGTVTSISIGSSGYGYVTAPSVTIAAPAGLGTQFTATGIATIRYDSIKRVGTIGVNTTRITGINTENMVIGDRVRLESGYDSPYDVVSIFPSGTFITEFEASTIILNNSTTNVGVATTSIEVGIQNCGIVTNITITNPGGGYLTPPTVTISNDTAEKNYIDEVPGVVRAVGVATVDVRGNVTAINMLNPGARYVVVPDIFISSPVGVAGTLVSGSFIFNEIVTGSTSGTTARVKEYNADTGVLKVSIVDGTFLAQETITGSESGAVSIIRSTNTDDTVDPFADNDTIELEADQIIDFSKSNPFGMP